MLVKIFLNWNKRNVINFYLLRIKERKKHPLTISEQAVSIFNTKIIPEINKNQRYTVASIKHKSED
jgi:hypothetical protein